jgi:hypothetical protein
MVGSTLTTGGWTGTGSTIAFGVLERPDTGFESFFVAIDSERAGGGEGAWFLAGGLPPVLGRVCDSRSGGTWGDLPLVARLLSRLASLYPLCPLYPLYPWTPGLSPLARQSGTNLAAVVLPRPALRSDQTVSPVRPVRTTFGL